MANDCFEPAISCSCAASEPSSSVASVGQDADKGVVLGRCPLSHHLPLYPDILPRNPYVTYVTYATDLFAAKSRRQLQQLQRMPGRPHSDICTTPTHLIPIYPSPPHTDSALKRTVDLPPVDGQSYDVMGDLLTTSGMANDAFAFDQDLHDAFPDANPDTTFNLPSDLPTPPPTLPLHPHDLPPSTVSPPYHHADTTLSDFEELSPYPANVPDASSPESSCSSELLTPISPAWTFAWDGGSNAPAALDPLCPIPDSSRSRTPTTSVESTEDNNFGPRESRHLWATHDSSSSGPLSFFSAQPHPDAMTGIENDRDATPETLYKDDRFRWDRAPSWDPAQKGLQLDDQSYVRYPPYQHPMHPSDRLSKRSGSILSDLDSPSLPWFDDGDREMFHSPPNSPRPSMGSLPDLPEENGDSDDEHDLFEPSLPPSSPSRRSIALLPDLEDEDMPECHSPSSPSRRSFSLLPDIEMDDAIFTHGPSPPSTPETSPRMHALPGADTDDDLISPDLSSADAEPPPMDGPSLGLFVPIASSSREDPAAAPPAPEVEPDLNFSPEARARMDPEQVDKLLGLRRRSWFLERNAKRTELSYAEDVRRLAAGLSVSPPVPGALTEYDESVRQVQAGGDPIGAVRRELQVAETRRAEARRERKKEKERGKEVQALLRLKLGETETETAPARLKRDGSAKFVIESMPQLVARMVLKRREAAAVRSLSGRRPACEYVRSPLSFGRQDGGEEEEKNEMGVPMEV